MAARHLPLCSTLRCNLQTGSKLAHVHPQRMTTDLWPGIRRESVLQRNHFPRCRPCQRQRTPVVDYKKNSSPLSLNFEIKCCKHFICHFRIHWGHCCSKLYWKEYDWSLKKILDACWQVGAEKNVLEIFSNLSHKAILLVKMKVFWNIEPCWLVNAYRLFGLPCCLHLQNLKSLVSSC